jgi:peptide/nickel transport system permease protein
MLLAKLVVRRLVLGLVTLWLVSVVVFAATQALPGDAARAIMGQQATPQRLQAVRKQLNLDHPVVQQYSRWLAGVATGDLGLSLSLHHTPVSSIIADRAANSLLLVAIAALIALPLSIIIGAAAAHWRDSGFDMVSSVVTLGLASLPEFVLGVGLILLFATSMLRIFPAVSPITREVPIWEQLDMFVLPAGALVLATFPYIARLLRASMIEVLESEYVAMARLKGMPEGLVLRRHVLPNALVPTIQGAALELAWLAGGIVVIEYLFGFPGIGQALVEAVQNRDIPVIQAVTLLVAGVYVVTNLAADILTILVTPRLRTGFR